MEYRVEVSARAAADAQEVIFRIAQQYPRRAERWRDGLVKAIESLSVFPERCSLAPEADAFNQEIRQQFHGKRRQKYRILFTVHEDTVHILRILHGARQSLQPGDEL